MNAKKDKKDKKDKKQKDIIKLLKVDVEEIKSLMMKILDSEDVDCIHKMGTSLGLPHISRVIEDSGGMDIIESLQSNIENFSETLSSSAA
jgi:hypothetical protein